MAFSTAASSSSSSTMSRLATKQIARSTTTSRPTPRSISSSSTTSASHTHLPSSSTTSSQSSPPQNTRTYTPRKEFLFRSYQHLLKTSSAILIFQHNNLSSRDLERVRDGLKGVKVPDGLIMPGEGGEFGIEIIEEEGDGKLKRSPGSDGDRKAGWMIARTGVLSAVVQDMEKRSRIELIRQRKKNASSSSSSSPSTPSPSTSILPLLSGPTALLTLPHTHLSPTYLSSLLSSLSRTFSYRPPSSSPNRLITSTSTLPVPSQLILLGALLENPSGRPKLYSAQEVVELAEHGKEMSVVRGELVGLLGGAGGGQLVGVLGQAAGGGLVRLLNGLENDLKEKEGKSEGVAA